MVKEYGLNVNLGLKFETEARRTGAINKLKELKALLLPEELLKQEVKKFDSNQATIDEVDSETIQDVDLG